MVFEILVKHIEDKRLNSYSQYFICTLISIFSGMIGSNSDRNESEFDLWKLKKTVNFTTSTQHASTGYRNGVVARLHAAMVLEYTKGGRGWESEMLWKQKADPPGTRITTNSNTIIPFHILFKTFCRNNSTRLVQ